MKNVFVLPNERLDAYMVYGDFTEVIYWLAKGKEVEGWVQTSRLVETGTGIGNKEEVEGKK